MKNFLILTLTSIALYSFAVLFKVHYESKVYNKTFIADLSNTYNLLRQNYIGTTSDSYGYIKNAYSIYKTLKPSDCFRPQAGYIFAPFIFIFREYFPLAIIVFNSIIFSILISTFFYILNPKKLFLNLLLLFIVFSFTFYYIPRIMLDPIISIFILISLIFLTSKRENLSTFFIFLSSIIRPEFNIILVLFVLFKRLYLLGSIFIIFNFFIFLINSKCKEQSNFFFWSAKGYYENIKKMDWGTAKSEIFKLCDEVDVKCYQKALIDELKKNYKEMIPYAIKNLITNPINLLFFPIDKYQNRLKIIYIFICLLYSTLLIISIINQRNEKLILYSLIAIIAIYDFYYILNPIDGSRSKLYTLPFELYLITKTLSDNQFQSYNYFPFFLQKRKSQDL